MKCQLLSNINHIILADANVWNGHLSNLVTMKLKETTQVLLEGYQIDEEKTFSSILCFDQMYDL